MQVSRRSMILGVSAAGVALIGGGTAWRVTRNPVSAVAPWQIDPTPPADVRLDAFRYAILAPNPHNRQPWLIELVGRDTAVIRCDLAKRLPETDPYDRQITIGFGTFIELARIAAAERGYAVAVTPFPADEPQPRLDARPVAKLVFRKIPGLVRDPLFAAITARRTNREVYDATPPSAVQLRDVAAEGVTTSTDPALLAQMRPLAVGAMTTEVTTPRTWLESVRLFRIGHAEIDANPDGLAGRGPLLEGLQAVGMIDRQQLADPTSMAFKSGLDQVRASCGSIPALIWIVTPGNSRVEQLDAGRRYARANLRATLLGLAMHPLSQALQEYPEMAPAFAKVHALIGAAPGARLQMLARIGKGPTVPPAPRWPLETHLT